MLKAVERIAKEGLLPNFIKAAPTANKKISKLPVLTYPEELNPFRSALCKIRLSEYENVKLNEFLEKAIAAENLDKLSKIVDEALDLGIRVNARNEDGFSFTNVIVVSKMNDKFSLRDYPLKAASLYVSALSFILENTIQCLRCIVMNSKKINKKI